ncbi:Hypothetical protein CINCED_3A010063 [Cinara cedri]|uniref:Uncharacterized protein n=1 Tax=Cinara cedri TaxID=506608 RepID=A0A5E4MLE9_9HEMI|nr:Hypothetical protein CINCED_3A010063 [Cinara cedri]
MNYSDGSKKIQVQPVSNQWVNRGFKYVKAIQEKEEMHENEIVDKRLNSEPNSNWMKLNCYSTPGLSLNNLSPEAVIFTLLGPLYQHSTEETENAEPENQMVNDLNVLSPKLVSVDVSSSIIQKMVNEGLKENEKSSDDVSNETDISILVEANSSDPNKSRKWWQKVTRITKITTITKVKEIQTPE